MDTIETLKQKIKEQYDIYTGICIGILGNGLYILLRDYLKGEEVSPFWAILFPLAVLILLIIIIIIIKRSRLLERYDVDVQVKGDKLTNRDIAKITDYIKNKISSYWSGSSYKIEDIKDGIKFLFEGKKILQISFKGVFVRVQWSNEEEGNELKKKLKNILLSKNLSKYFSKEPLDKLDRANITLGKIEDT